MDYVLEILGSVPRHLVVQVQHVLYNILLNHAIPWSSILISWDVIGATLNHSEVQQLHAHQTWLSFSLYLLDRIKILERELRSSNIVVDGSIQ